MKTFNITEKHLNNFKCRYYGGGNELKVGDVVYNGFTVNYANINGTPPSKHNPNEISLSLKMFVEKNGFLYELYNLKLKNE